MAQRHALTAITASVLTVGSSSTNEMPPESKKGLDAGHGNRFQSKLLMLFCIRAINEGYEFYLGTELAEQGKKFDDLIFKYKKDKKANKTGDNWPYQYLQAKSRLKEKVDKITAKDLFAVPVKGKNINVDFSLPKYFRSYLEITKRGDKIDSCIICTNIDFDNEENLQENGIEVKEVQLADPILKLKELSNNKIPKRYRLHIESNSRLSNILKEETTSKLLAKMLCDSINGEIKLNSKSELIQYYHMALVKEHVIDLAAKKFQDDFIKGSDGLSEGAKELRQNLIRFNINIELITSFTFNFDKNFGKKPLQPEIFNYPLPLAEIYDFLDKLIFAVNTPNEGELDDVLKSEVGKYYKLLNTDLESAYIMNEMVNWFKREYNVWLSSEEAKTLFLDKTQTLMESIRVNEISIDYQKQLKNDLMGLEFNSDAIQVMTEKLKTLFGSKSSSVIIFTESPQHTAVKLVAAIKTFPEFKCDDSFLVASSKRLEDEDQMKKFKASLELKKDSHTLLVIVFYGEGSPHNDTKYTNLIPEGRKDNKINKIVIICPDKTAKMTDEIKYTELTDEFKQKILSLEVSFQLKKGVSQQELENNRITVGELIGNKPEEVIDSNSIKELTKTGQEIKIPSFDDTTHFEELMYIRRQLKFPFHDKIEGEIATSLNCPLDQLQKECKIHPDGKIEWLVQQGKRQNEIWEKIKDVANQLTSSDLIDEDNHMKGDGKEKSIFIISGVAGTGKSTLLSHYYEEIKQSNPDHWIIRINLVDHYEAILKFNNFNRLDTFNFFVNQLHIVDGKSPFSRSLLKNRLETGDRIVVMFDGFDEVNDQCKEMAIQLMKSITKEKIKIYVTTRPHMLDKLQFELSQLAFRLENFTEKDQIDFVASYWKKELNLSRDYNGCLQQFAKLLIERVSETLKDKDKTFIGVPLQCRILAECFQSEFQAKMKPNNKDGMEQTDFENQLQSNVKFNLNSLYKLLMKTKRQVFREQKANFSNQNEIVVDAVNRLIQDIESRLTKLAIETLVTDKKNVDILWPPQFSYHQLKTEKIQKERRNNELCVQFGLIIFKDADEGGKVWKTQFLHRTFAEYLLAKYLYEGIAIDHCENNQLLDNELVRDLIVNQILVEDNYDGVRVFIDSMLKETINSKKWRLIIKKEVELPFQLKNFANSLAHQITAQREDDAERSSPNSHPNPITVSLRTSNMNLFYTLFDCLDRKFDQIEMNSIIRSALDKRCFSFDFFINFSNSELFRRVMNHYDDADSNEMERIVKEMLYRNVYKPTSFTLESYLSAWNKETSKEIVKVVLDFMEKHQSNINTIWNSESNPYMEYHRNHFSVKLLHFFTFNEYYDSLFNQFFHLLSSNYSNDCDLIKLLKFTLRMRDSNYNNWAYPLNSGIEKTLTNLRNLGRYKVMEGLSHMALVSDKKVFDKFYQPCPSNMTEDCSNFPLLLENDSNRMTYVVRDIELAVPYTCERFTPFYVAAACGHKEICHKILSFSKENFGTDRMEDLTKNGFVYCAMWDAILFENLHMFQLILEVVKEAWGQESLLVLMKTENSEIRYNKSWSYVRNPYTEEFEKKLLKIKVKVILQNDSEKGYENLRDFIFSSVDSPYTIITYDRVKGFVTFKDMEDETLEGMLSDKGLVDWMKRFFNWEMNSDWKFRFLSDHLLARFTSHQRSQFVDAITSPYSPKYKSYPIDISYWARSLLDLHFPTTDISFLEKLLKIIADNDKNSGRSDIQKLLFNDNGKDITRVLMCQDRKIVSIVSPNLSRADRIKIKKFVRKNGPEIIDEIFQPSLHSMISRFKQEALRYWVNILSFYDDGTRKPQFEKLVKTLLLLRTETNNPFTQLQAHQYSFWSKYLDNYNDEDGNKVEMVDKFLKLVSEKLGKRALIQVVLHKDGKGIVLLGAELQENKQLVKVILSHLSDRDRDCVYLLFIKNSPFNSRQ